MKTDGCCASRTARCPAHRPSLGPQTPGLPGSSLSHLFWKEHPKCTRCLYALPISERGDSGQSRAPGLSQQRAFLLVASVSLSHLTAVSTQQDKPLLRQHVPHKVNEPAWAHGMAPCLRVGQGRGMCSTGCHNDNACMLVAARTFCLLLASAGCAPFFLLPACIARIQVSRDTGCIGGI